MKMEDQERSHTDTVLSTAPVLLQSQPAAGSNPEVLISTLQPAESPLRPAACGESLDLWRQAPHLPPGHVACKPEINQCPVGPDPASFSHHVQPNLTHHITNGLVCLVAPQQHQQDNKENGVVVVVVVGIIQGYF